MSQSRTPRGVPTGGEFASNTHDEAKHWLAGSDRTPEPNCHLSIGDDGKARIVGHGGTYTLSDAVLDLDASPYVESVGFHDPHTGVTVMRYGVEVARPTYEGDALVANSHDEVDAAFDEMRSRGIPADRIYASSRDEHDGRSVTRRQLRGESFPARGVLFVEAGSGEEAASEHRRFEDWLHARHFDVREVTIAKDLSVSEPETLASSVPRGKVNISYSAPQTTQSTGQVG